MDVELLEPDVLLAFLPSEPLMQPELRLLWKDLCDKDPLHLILDMSRVEIISSPSVGSLLLLRKLQSERGFRLLLCNVHLATRCILRVVGLDTIFDYAHNRREALRMLGQPSRASAEAQGVGLQGNDAAR